jgi:hypothetical protein
VLVQTIERHSERRQSLSWVGFSLGWTFPSYPENWTYLRQDVLARDGFCCRKCGTSIRPLQVDHIVPLSRGGTNNLGNLQTLCLRCHSFMHPHMAARYRPRTELVVHRLGLVGFYAILLGSGMLFGGLVDIAFPTLRESGPWSPGQPLPPLTLHTVFPEPLFMFVGFVLLLIGIVSLVLDPPRPRHFGKSI